MKQKFLISCLPKIIRIAILLLEFNSYPYLRTGIKKSIPVMPEIIICQFTSNVQIKRI